MGCADFECVKTFSDSNINSSQIASSLSQMRVLCCTLKMSSFRLEIGYFKSLGFYSSSEPEIEEILDGSGPGFSFAQISLLLWSYTRFWLSFMRDRDIE